MPEFEWDPEKEKKNISKHGIDFEIAARVFQDALVYVTHDEAHSGPDRYGNWEDRYIAIGRVEAVLYVVYSIRDVKGSEVIRMISARVAEKFEEELYYQWCAGRMR